MSQDSARLLVEHLTPLRSPLLFAARRQFAALSRLRDLEPTLRRLARPIRDASSTKRVRDKLDRFLALFDGFDALPVDEQQTVVLSALRVLDSLDQAVFAQAPKDERSFVRILNRLRLRQSVQVLRGIGEKAAQALAQKDILTVSDLLYYLPRRYDDRRDEGSIAELTPGHFGQSRGEIISMSSGRRFHKKQPFEVAVRDATGFVTLSWFHYGATHIPKRFAIGDRVCFAGKVTVFRGRKQIVHPEMELEETQVEAPGSLASITPLYSDVPGVNGKTFRSIMARVAAEYAPLVEDPLLPAFRGRFHLETLSECLLRVHQPKDDDNVLALNECATPWQERLIFDEFFYVQVVMAMRRGRNGEEPGYAHERLNNLATRYYQGLSFKLTQAQKRVVREIVSDLERPSPMNRLLQGDVGSGKTVVAVLTALMVLENKRQVALMAPTEILAEQHARGIAPMLEPLGLRVGLLTAGMSAREKRSLLEDMALGRCQFVVGTHALFQDQVAYKELGYVIIDEQHRFGVRQRVALSQKGTRPDCLVMTATPIPRSLALTVYGDLEVSVLDERPPGRQPIDTRIIREDEEDRLWQTVRRELDQGRQAYVVVPLIDESETLDLKNVTEETVRLSEGPFSGYRVAMLHGRMSSAEKEQVMRSFSQGEIQVLVATTVVEVGVDVPNATVMVIAHAERFGLAQLHQLRGRVGRGEYASSCYLLVGGNLTDDGFERLGVMEQTDDGFRIAEKDLEIRGPGDFIGTRQSGLPGFRLANLIRDREILELAKTAAQAWVEDDPDLSGSDSLIVRGETERAWNEDLDTLLVG